jgi:phosphatidylserine/phosphatidylglycerophosphate/cardiolipin synthase-like enzyme
MRKKVNGDVVVRAVSGTYVVFLAMNMEERATRGLLGFSIQRTDLIEDETVWLRGNKTFASIRESTGIEDASSREHPFQAFQWADYAAKPGYRYRYRITPMYGRPAALEPGATTTVTIETEPLEGDVHNVHFNRGAIASQAFSRRFPGQTLDEAGPPAYDWLARDLLPALLAFLRRAKNSTFGLRAAIYELKLPVVLEAFRAAHLAGADVKIIYHALPGETGDANEAAIDAARIRTLCRPRRKAKLMHNKFIVLTKSGRPISVWSGSTNLSRNALYGQLNVGLGIHDPAVASAYLDYWNALYADPDSPTLKSWTESHNPIPPRDESASITPVFSPHRGRGVFDWWITHANSAQKALFMTFPFGIVQDFRPVYDQNDAVLRFGLLDKYVNGGTPASRAAAIADIERIRRFKNVGMALGNKIFVDWVDGWRKEADPIGVNVNWVHTKFMLVDPLGTNPVILSGSANWSLASADTNDENLNIIRDDQRVADIYFGEFMRIFAHHRFRESVKRHIERYGTAAFNSWKPQDLFEDWRKWAPHHYRAGSEHDIKRRYFADV